MTNSNRIYLDYAASAPLRPEARDAWLKYHDKPFSMANPNSLHSYGREAAAELEKARRSIVSYVGGGFRPSELLFTSGGTESNNMALLGIAEGVRKSASSKNRVVMSAIEHDSVLDVATLLRSRGFEVVLVKPNSLGQIDPQSIAEAMGDSCALVSVMAANNETGIIQDIAAITQVVKNKGSFIHVDAIQGFGRIKIDFTRVDAVSIAAHKIGGPLGIGALALRSRTPFIAQSLGGGQEGGKRPGTQDVAAAVAFAAATSVVFNDLESKQKATRRLADYIYKKLCSTGTDTPNAQRHPVCMPTVDLSADVKRLPGIVNIMVPYIDSETLILQLDEAGFEVSAGSACSSGSLNPSHVLSAMGKSRDLALGSLRISFDETLTLDEAETFCETLIKIIHNTR